MNPKEKIEYMKFRRFEDGYIDIPFSKILFLKNFENELDKYKYLRYSKMLLSFDLPKDALSCVSANLYHCYLKQRSSTNKTIYIHYSRNRNSYKNLKHLTYEVMMRAVDVLGGCELIAHKKTRRGSWIESTIKPTGKLIGLFKLCHVSIGVMKEHLVQLKDNERRLVHFKPNKKTNAWMNTLIRLNSCLNKTSVCVRVPRKELCPEVDQGIYEWVENRRIPDFIQDILSNLLNDNISTTHHLPIVIPTEQLKLLSVLLPLHFIDNSMSTENFFAFYPRDTEFKRIFNHNGSRKFTHGGRFYGHLQNIPSHYRRYIHFGEEQATELDYSGLHPRMLYAMKGVDYRNKPYLESTLELRSLSKQLLLALFNASSKQQVVESVYHSTHTSVRKNQIHDILRTLEEKHEPIKEYFYSGIGLKLQRKDSDIAYEVMKSFVKLEKEIIPIHDSFVVRKSDRDLLKALMVKAYKRIVGFEPIIDQKY